ncbi:MAG: ParB N-terminal domain-containing protein [Bryobacteraceae bacterium]
MACLVCATERAMAQLKTYAHNARTDSDSQIPQMAASIREFGLASPILVGTEGVNVVRRIVE